MKNTRITTWQIYTLGALLCVAFTVALFQGVISPTIQRTQRQAALQRDLHARLDKIAMLSGELNSCRRQSAELKQSLSRDGVKLQSMVLVNDRLAKLTALAISDGLALDEVRAGSAADAPTLETLPIQLSGAGPYPNCVRFLHQLHETFPDTLVKSLDTTSAPSATRGTNAAFRFELVWYTHK